MINPVSSHTIGLIGVGNFGPNIYKSLCKMGNIPFVVSDIDKNKANPFSPSKYEDSMFTTDPFLLIEDKTIETVFISTPAFTHYELAKASILKGKHVFLEKPMTLIYSDAVELLELSKEHERLLHVDNTFCYSKEVSFLKYITDFNLLGKPVRYFSNRSNFGPFRKDITVVFDLLCHDISIINYLFPYYNIDSVCAIGDSERAKTELIFNNKSDKITANIDVSWHSKKKIRDIAVEFEGGIVYVDSLDSDGFFEIRDNKNKILNAVDKKSFPFLGNPLDIEILHFLNNVKYNSITLSSPEGSVENVRVLQAVDKSILEKKEVKL